jgi:hypothetical protein
VITRMFEVLYECIANEEEWIKKLLPGAKVEDGKVIIDATTHQLYATLVYIGESGELPSSFPNLRQMMAQLLDSRELLESQGWTVNFRSRRDGRGHYLHRFSRDVA